MEEADGSEDSVEVVGGPLVYPGVAVSHRHSDQTEAVGQAAQNQQGELPHWHRGQLTLETQNVNRTNEHDMMITRLPDFTDAKKY